MIALNSVVFPPTVYVKDPFARKLEAVRLADHMGIAMCLAGRYRARLI